MRLLAPALLILALTACVRPEPAAVQAPVAAPVSTPQVNVPKVSAQEVKLPEFIPDKSFPPNSAVTSIGSDSMDPLMQLLMDDFVALHPGTTYTLISKGSATAPPALIAGRTLMGQMSREMNDSEIAAFQAKFGYPPTRIVVAMDALAVYVNANNPIPQLSLEQVDAIFSKDRKAGYPKSLEAWGDLGLTQEWKNRQIQPYGRDENSGTRAFFKEHVLKNGEYKPTVKAVTDQFELVEAAAMNASAIAYGPIQHSVGMVRAVPVVDFNATVPVFPTVENILNGKYPLSRFLYIYVNRRPNHEIDPVLKEFIRFVLSRQGQNDVANFGALPLPGDIAAINLNKIR